jgi:hypothetical protein
VLQTIELLKRKFETLFKDKLNNEKDPGLLRTADADQYQQLRPK